MSKKNINNNQKETHEEILTKLAFVHNSARNVIKKCYSADKYFNYRNDLTIFGKNYDKVTRIGGAAQRGDKYNWLFTDMEDFYIDELTEDYIVLRKHSLGDPSQYGNQEYGKYYIGRNVIRDAYTTYLKEVRKACHTQKKRSNRVFVKMYGNERLKEYERQINLILKIQRDIKSENWHILD